MSKPHKHAEFICAKANGAEIQERIAGSSNWLNMLSGDWEFSPNCEYRIKPEPKYPKTRMTGNELLELLREKSSVFGGFIGIENYPALAVELANAAIRRAIEDGDVILPEVNK